MSMPITPTPMKSRYDHAKGIHDVGPGVRAKAKADGARLLGCELYYPLDRGTLDPEFSETLVLVNGVVGRYVYSFDTNTVYFEVGA